MMKIYIPGYSTVQGRPVTILRLMQQGRRFDSDGTLDDYIQAVQQDIWRIYNKPVEITGETLEERAACLLHRLAENGLIEILEE